MSEEAAYKFTRARNIGMQRAIYALSQKHPKTVRRLLLKAIEVQLKGKVDMKHFTPSYNPWDQRLCVVPHGDLFKILREGKASVETDQIEKFTEKVFYLNLANILMLISLFLQQDYKFRLWAEFRRLLMGNQSTHLNICFITA